MILTFLLFIYFVIHLFFVIGLMKKPLEEDCAIGKFWALKKTYKNLGEGEIKLFVKYKVKKYPTTTKVKSSSREKIKEALKKTGCS